jgi:glycosyltransferase involved in cell wall biosynthesis
MVRLSLIVPAHNEEKYLPSLLDSIEEARRRFSFGPSSIEVIVADNQSTDDTAAVASEYGCLVVQEKTRKRSRSTSR